MSIKIYRTQLTPARNALLDNIEDYLNQIQNPPYNYTGTDEMTYSAANFQYIKPELDISIKINMPINNNGIFDSIGNYVRIEQSQGAGGVSSIWYYFIISSKWVAQGTLELVCSMDTINTFHSYLTNINNWSSKTSIYRQHGVPLKKQNNKLIEVVDRYDEGIDPGVLYKVEDTKIEEPNSLGIKEWYLVYQTTTAAKESSASENKMRCYLYPSENIVYSKTAGKPAESFTLNTFSYNNTYGIINGGVSFSVSGLTWQSPQTSSAYNEVIKYTQVYNSGSLIYNQSNSNSFPAMSGNIYIDNSFVMNGSTYVCDRILWNKDSETGLPMGIFKSGSNSVQAFYLTSFNGTTINKWVVPYVYVSVETISARKVRTHVYRRFYTVDSIGSAGSIYSNLYTSGEGFYVGTRTYTFSSTVQTINRIALTQSYPDALTISAGTVYYSNGDSPAAAQIIQSIKEIDRQDAKLVKILAIPYCPTPITIGSGSVQSGTYTLSFDSDIIDIESTPITTSPERYRLYYKNLDGIFGKNLDSVNLSTKYTDRVQQFWAGNIGLSERSIENEPKLKNSKFYRDLFVYDNVNKLIRREDLDPQYETINITPYFMPTNTIDSKLMFKFNIDKAEYKEIYEWDRVLISTRDNELPIYNNDYINYLRYSYKAERENLQASAQAQRQSAYTSSVLTTGGGMLSGALLGAKLGSVVPGLGTAIGAIGGAVIGLAAGIAQSASTINSTNTTIENAERSMSQKLLELNNTASSVINGSAAVDLMTEYTGNRLHHMVYEMPDLLKEAVYDRLFYCGYSHPVQDVPAMSNRYIFNFIQCNPVFIDESTNRYNYYMADIKDRFNTGITRYHNISTLLRRQDQSQLYTDWKQEYENWYLNRNLTTALEQNLTYIDEENDRFEIDINFNTQDSVINASPNDGFKYVVKVAWDEDDYAHNYWEDYIDAAYESPATIHPRLRIVNGSLEILNRDSANEIIPYALKFKLVNEALNIEGEEKVIILEKPEKMTLNWPEMTAYQLDLDLSSEYDISTSSNYRYQLAVKYNNQWLKYPYFDNTDYSNDYTTQHSFQVEGDFVNRDLNYTQASILYARVINIKTGEYSQWRAVDF